MKKNIFILLVLSFLLVGCSAEYNLEIGQDSFKESVDIVFPKSEFTINDINGIMAEKTPITQEQGQTKFYNNSVKENSQNYIVNENYTHSIDTISNSYLISRCYGSNTIKQTENKITIETGNKFMCIYMDDGAEMDSAVVNITTKLKVVSNNADAISNNTYTWNINKENYTNKPIYMEIQLDKSNQIFSDFQIQLGLTLLVLVLIFGGIYLYVNKKNQENNSI